MDSVIYIAGMGGKRVSEMVVSKTKVSPLKHLSIPRLELCACLLLSTLMVNVENALLSVVDVEYVYCWSDSLDALFWIKEEDRKRKLFIENRVKKIRKNVAPANWRHCPTDRNPADIPSRGMKSLKTLKKDFEKWTLGPEFIREDESSWPEDNPRENKDDVTTKVSDAIDVIRMGITSIDRQSEMEDGNDANRFTGFDFM